jgi:hypothetical protein
MPRASHAVRRAALLVLGSVAILCGCAADSSDPLPTESQAVLAGSGGTTTTQSCKASLGECTIGCDASYRELALGGRTLNDAYKKACKDACDAAYNRCTDAGTPRPNAVP